MVDRDHRIPSDAVVQESSHTAGGKVSEDGGTTTVMWKKNTSMDGLRDSGGEDQPAPSLNKSVAAQQGDDKAGDRNYSSSPLKTKKETSEPPPRLPVGKMKWSQAEERAPDSGGKPRADGESRSETKGFPEAGKADRKSIPDNRTASPGREGKKGDSGKESSESPRKKKIPVGVLKWRKDEETDEVKKENSTGKGKVFRLPDFGKDEEEPGEEPSSAQRRLRKAVKVLWIPTLLFGSLLIGLMIGYAGLGGQSPLEVFDPDLWSHIYQLVCG